MSDMDFLSFLVEETLKLQESGEVELSSLELKLTDYGLSFIKGFYIPQFQMLRFKSEIGAIDIPVNWSVFNVDKVQSSDVVLSDSEDHDHLFQILKCAWKYNVSKILITHADGYCYIIALKAGEEVHLHDLLNPQEWLKAA